MIEHEIQSQLSAYSTPQQNGVSKRKKSNLVGYVRSMMSFGQLQDSFLVHALETIVYILNNVSFKSILETTSEL